MVWNGEKDKAMLKEMAAAGVMHKKPKSRDRGAAWEKVVNNLNSLPQFEISQKSLRDRYKLLAKKYKVKMGKEERSTGGGGEGPNELEGLLEELIEMEEDAEQRTTDENTARQNNIEADRGKAMEMRKRAMESMGETRERLQETDKAKKKRRSNSDGMHALEKAIERKQQIDEEERKAKAEDRQQQLGMQEAFLRQLEATQQQQTAQFKITEQQLLSTIHQQQQQQQQQVQQFAAMQHNMVRMMEQQQRQTELILELFRKSNNNA
jgi:hypothetical protein